MLEDGRIAYQLRRPRLDGTTHLLLRPMELLEKLAALVPPPWQHQIHFHGVLAHHARWRELIVPPSTF